MTCALLLPVDTDGADHALYRIGFRFGDLSEDAPGMRDTVLPQGWAAKGLRWHQPLYLVDHLLRLRLVVRYPAVGAPSMRIVSLTEYLDGCVATETPVLTDDWWATPTEVELAACARSSRAQAWAAEFTRQHCGRLADHYLSQARAWRLVAARFNTSLEIAA